MPDTPQAREVFTFSTRLHLSESTGLKAATLEQLLEILQHAPGSCVYHHTHRFLQQHQHLSPEPPNDFAYWISEVLGEDELGERVASIDIIQFNTIRGLREKIIATIDDYVKANPSARLRFARPHEEFHFIKSVSFVVPTHFSASNLREFVDALDRVTVNSLYFHIFEARLRLENKTNDFSNWIETSLDNRELADRIGRIDPYTYAMDDLRKTVIKIINESGCL